LTTKDLGRILKHTSYFHEDSVTMRGHRVLRNKCLASGWRSRAGWLLLFALPSVMVGQAGSGAMLAARGNVAVNGRVVGTSQALLPGDLTVTQRDSGGNLTQNGTNAMLGPETALRYEGEYAVLERGAVSANTQSAFAVQAGCWTVKPQVWNQWTEFAVSYASAGEVLIQARGSDVRVYARTQKARDKKSEKTVDLASEADRNRDVNGAPIGTPNGAAQDPQPDRGELLRAGQEMRREACPVADQQSRRRPGGGAASAATTGPLNSTGALYGGAAVAGVVTVLFLVRHDEPASPKNP
jgi:hypothetical protein